MLTGWFERTRNETETISTTTDDTKGRHDYWEEGMGLAVGTKHTYLGSMEREALQRREQEMKERRAIEKEKWREQRRILPVVPKYGPSYPPSDLPHTIVVIGQDDKFSGDEETIAEPTSPRSDNFATVPYDPGLNDLYPDLFNPGSERKPSRKPQRSHRRDDNEVEPRRQESFLPSLNALRANSNSTLLGLNIERLLSRPRSGGGAIGRSRISGPGVMRMGSLPFSPAAPNQRFPPRNSPR